MYVYWPLFYRNEAGIKDELDSLEEWMKTLRPVSSGDKWIIPPLAWQIVVLDKTRALERSFHGILNFSSG